MCRAGVCGLEHLQSLDGHFAHRFGGLGTPGIFGKSIHARFRHRAAAGGQFNRWSRRHGGSHWRHVHCQACWLHPPVDRRVPSVVYHRILCVSGEPAYHSLVEPPPETDGVRYAAGSETLICSWNIALKNSRFPRFFVAMLITCPTSAKMTQVKTFG